jgi:hypothetical protein
MKRPVIGHGSKYVCVCQILKTTALTLESSIFSHFFGQVIQLFCGELGSTHARTRLIITLSLIILDKWALLTLGHMSIILLFFMPFF